MSSPIQNNNDLDLVFFISHANVAIDPDIPVPNWGLSEKGMLRHQKFNENKLVKNISAIYSSKEQKAIDAAQILSKHTGLNFQQLEALGEIDRSSTGYLAEDEFQATVNLFFENPDTSIRGWERAIDAQKRIVKAIKNIITLEKEKKDIAIVAHGGVGALLLSYLLKKDISRKFDQPFNGGGNYFCFERSTLKVRHDWKDISRNLV